MARTSGRPARTLVVFFLSLGVIYGLVALAGSWTPKLGLDLEGGTRIQLQAVSGDINTDTMNTARQIIDDRVNGSGVAEAEVTTQGSDQILVEIPGKTRADVVETIKRQAQLRFRLVAASMAVTSQPTLPSDNAGTGVTAPANPSDQASTNNRPGIFTEDPTSAPSTTTVAPSTAPSTGASASSSATSSETATTDTGPTKDEAVNDGLSFMRNPPADWTAKLQTFQCGDRPVNVEDNPNVPLLTCDPDGTVKYLLSPALIDGSNLDGAAAGIPQGQLGWVVTLDLDGRGTDVFRDLSTQMVNTNDQFAIVLDGEVIRALGFSGVIPNGQAQIEGMDGEADANSLATSLKYGALPVRFASDPLVETVGPSLAGDQLNAGLWAGAFGLGLVMLYCLVYYRGLGLVIMASLFVAGGLTYGVVLLLSEAASFTLTLPGIAGLIVAVGITADSFIVFFERIRDEMRDGMSLPVAIERGWVRARRTCVAADTVSILAAVVLYLFATSDVRGFAFALGVSTLIDLAVFFWFTKPVVSLAGHRRFFSSGHKLSGLDREALGLAPTAGGKS